jgi:hypothetical protein
VIRPAELLSSEEADDDTEELDEDDWELLDDDDALELLLLDTELLELLAIELDEDEEADAVI